MVGGLEACGRVAAVALLAVGSAVPYSDSTAMMPRPAPVADVVTACSVTVGTATTDPALATDAARALTAGYAVTDCMPSADLLAAAEARAALSLPPAPVGGESAVGGAVVGTSSGATAASIATARQGTGMQGAATAASTPTASAVPTTSAASTATVAETTTTPTSTGTASTDTSSTDTSSSTDTTGSSGTSTTESSTGDVGTSDDGTDSGSSGSSGSIGDSGSTVGDGTATDGTAADSTATDGTATGSTATGSTTTAAARLGWGQATRNEDFDGDLSAWDVDDGPGAAGKGRRSPDAISVAGGVVTLSGDAAGSTGGMAWRGGATYGRWEARVKVPVGDPTYHAVLRLSPDADGDPAGAIDLVDIGDARQKADFVLHDGDSDPLRGHVAIDATRWHDWAVEWAPDHITAYVDGQEWYTTRATDAFPPGPLHLALSLDRSPEAGDAVQPSTMSVDWVRYYPPAGDGSTAADTAAATSTTADISSTTDIPTTAVTPAGAVTPTVTATSTADPHDADASNG